MEYWRGYMSWPIDPDWKCQTCGGPSLIWGLVNGQCRCMKCHTQYFMKDEKGDRVTTPICWLRPEFQEPAREFWKENGTPIDGITREQWIRYGVPESLYERT